MGLREPIRRHHGQFDSGVRRFRNLTPLEFAALLQLSLRRRLRESALSQGSIPGLSNLPQTLTIDYRTRRASDVWDRVFIVAIFVSIWLIAVTALWSGVFEPLFHAASKG